MSSGFSVPRWLEQTVIVLVNVFIAFAAGSATDARKFRKVNKFAPLLPIVSQFAIQPLIVSGLCQAFGLHPFIRVGMILCATTPGGNGSNIAEVIFGGDVELGIFMTFCSTIVSAGAIPLNYKYLAVPLIESEQNGNAPVPWQAIGTAAAILIGGSSAGCLVRFKNEKLGKRLEFWCIKIGVLLLILGIGVALAQTAPIWGLLDWRTFVCGLCMPWWKFIITYGAARIFRLETKVCETAAMEAGEQNIAVALAIISLAFEDSLQRNLMLAGLMVYTLFNQAFATPIFTFLFWRFGQSNQLRLAHGRKASCCVYPRAVDASELEGAPSEVAAVAAAVAAEPPHAAEPKSWWQLEYWSSGTDHTPGVEPASMASSTRGQVVSTDASPPGPTRGMRGLSSVVPQVPHFSPGRARP